MSDNIHYRLIIRRGPQPNQSFELSGSTVSLGRDIINDITISDPEVSRQHCQFIMTDNGYTLRDLNSTNGTFVNGKKMDEDRLLKTGDRIGFGETVLISYMAQPIPDHPRSEAVSFERTVAPDEATTEMPAMPVSAVDEAQVAVDPTPTSPPPKAPPAYMYQPPATRTVPEGSRFALLGCGLLTAMCLVSVFTSIILIDAADGWGDVPVLGAILEEAPVPMDTLETSTFRVPIPRDWERAVLDFDDVSIIITSPDDLPFDHFENGYAVEFENKTGVMIIGLQGNQALSVESLQNRMLITNGLTNLATTPGADSVSIDDKEGTRYTLSAPDTTAADEQTDVQIVEVEDGDDRLFMVLLSSSSDSREIFDYMMETLQFASED